MMLLLLLLLLLMMMMTMMMIAIMMTNVHGRLYDGCMHINQLNGPRFYPTINYKCGSVWNHSCSWYTPKKSSDSGNDKAALHCFHSIHKRIIMLEADVAIKLDFLTVLAGADKLYGSNASYTIQCKSDGFHSILIVLRFRQFRPNNTAVSLRSITWVESST